jgi:hypothetical protein
MDGSDMSRTEIGWGRRRYTEHGQETHFIRAVLLLLTFTYLNASGPSPAPWPDASRTRQSALASAFGCEGAIE